MTRLIGPDSSDRLAYATVGTQLRSAAGLTAKLYADEAGTTPADLLDLGGDPIPVVDGAAVVTIDSTSRYELMQYPDGNVKVIYSSVNGGPIEPLFARTDDRFAAATAGLAAHEADTIGVHGLVDTSALETQTGAQAKASAAQAAAIQRANHTGTQAHTTITGLGSAATMTSASLAADSAFSAGYVRTASLGGRALRLSDLLPVMSAPYTTTYTNVSGGTVSSGSTISGAVRIPAETPGAFRYIGATLGVGGSASGVTHWGARGGSTGPQQSSPPFAVEFDLDTVGGSFDVIIRQFTAAQIRVAVDGQYVTRVATFTPNQSGISPCLCNVSGLSAGRHRVRVECNQYVGFIGVNVQASDSVKASTAPKSRVIVIGDSYTEPTVADSTTNAFGGFGWVQALGLILGVDAWSSGSGGTGYLNPGGSSRVKFRDRLGVDVVPYNPDMVIWAGGHNDVVGFTAAQISAEAALCYSTLAAALPNCQQIVAGPIWGGGPNALTGLAYDARDAIRSAALAAGLVWIDPQESPLDLTAQGASTLQASTSGGATTFSSGVNYRIGTWLKIGTTSTQEVRQTTNQSGSGPYTMTVAALASAHASGDPIIETGPGWATGTGRQGSTNGTGSADRYTGSDGTHPTQSGHEALGLHIARALYAALGAH